MAKILIAFISVTAAVIFLCTATTANTAGAAKEIKREGRFIAHDDGTLLDTKTSLMWAAKDNGYNIDWPEAKKYCESFRLGGFTDWRMPTIKELETLYDSSSTGFKTQCSGYPTYVKTFFNERLSCPWLWASDYDGSNHAETGFFCFTNGEWYSQHKFVSRFFRVLPVRSGK